MISQAKTVLIAGAGTFGHWNAGDEAILAAMVKDLRSTIPEAQISVVSDNPSGTLARYDVREIPLHDITQLISAARASDLMLIGGGGLFYDYWGFDPGKTLTSLHGGLAFYLGFALLATLLDKPLMIYAVGVGPLLSEIGRSFTRAIFEQARLATVRDAGSKALLAAIGLETEHVSVTADPAFTLQPADDEQVQRLLEQICMPVTRPLIGVALRHWELGVAPDYWEREVAAALDGFIERNGGTILFVPFHRTTSLASDRLVSDRVMGLMKSQGHAYVCPEELLPEEKAGLLRKCDLVLGMRLHSIIFAIKAGVPTVALNYDPKVANILAELKQSEYGLELGSLTSEQLTSTLMRAYENRGQLSATWLAHAERLEVLGQENAHLAAGLLRGDVVAPPVLSPSTTDLIKGLVLKQSLRAHELQQSIEALQRHIAERDQAHAELHSQRAAQEHSLQTLLAQLAESERVGQMLSAQVAERDQAAQALSAQIGEREKALQALSIEVKEKGQVAEALRVQVTEKDQVTQTLRVQVTEKDQVTQALRVQVTEKDQVAQALRLQVVEKGEALQTLSAQVAEKDQVVQSLHLAVAERETRLYEQYVHLTSIIGSRGWRLVQMLWRLRRQLVPNGSQRFKFLSRGKKKLLAVWPAELKLPASDSRSAVASEASATTSAQALHAPAILQQHLGDPTDSRRVPIVTPTFFDFAGNDMYFGGAERYLIELARLIRELGYEPEVYQCGNSSWIRYYDDLRVIGIDAGGDMRRLNEEFHKLVPEGALTIYLAFFLATPHCYPRSIGISHGVYWDHALYHTTSEVLQGKLAEIFIAFSNVAQMVSVDTNTINWTRGLWNNLAGKFTYIPNFVDVEQFHPVKRNVSDSESHRLRILYPRRLYEPRGFWLVADLIPEFVERYPEIDFHFVGKADSREEKAAMELVARYPGRVQWYFLPPERMPEAYQQADITLVPTVSSEGTSLSCLEGLASGNAVIATNVGGLPNLVLSGHNGLLIEPTAAALRDALSLLIEDSALRRRLGRRARHVAKAFSLERWREQWRGMLRPHLPHAEQELATRRVKVALFPTAPGISWEPIQQRPHHLALQLARYGIETFWGNPDGRQASPAAHLHIVGPHDDLYLRAPFIFIYYPFHFKEIDKYDRPFVVYDILDDISIHDKSDAAARLPIGERARDYHLKLLERADLVITSSRVLLEQLRMQRPDVLLVPNGVDIDHFSIEVLPANGVENIARPVIGYHGAIAEWFDSTLLNEVVRLRPQYQFVLIGPVSQPELLTKLKRQPNVHYMGSIPYEQIPSYVAGFDVGILPFLLNKVTEGVRPLKVLEYLAMGKPAVTTTLPELTDWPGVLRAQTAVEFAAHLDLALEQRTELAHDPQVRSFVASSAWTEVVKPLLRAIEQNGG